MEVKEAIWNRRSIRKYKDTPISDEDIKDIMQAGCMGPTAMNLQPYHFIAIKNPEKLNELKSIVAGKAAEFLPALLKRFPNHPEVVEQTNAFHQNLGGASFCVLAFIRKPDYEKNISTLVQSVAAPLENMCLAAYEKGIASCWLTSPLENGAAALLKEHFAPDKGDFVALLTFGYPDQEAKAPRRHEDRVEYIL